MTTILPTSTARYTGLCILHTSLSLSGGERDTGTECSIVGAGSKTSSRTTSALRSWAWTGNGRIAIDIAGNHDIGYAGDITSDRLQRFERVFGKANWETRFSLPFPLGESQEGPGLRFIVLNSLNLETPARDSDIQADTYKFMNDIISSLRPVEDKSSGTKLLTHLPLYKEAGVCVDGPYFTYYDEQYGAGVREQNHLSYDASVNILQGIYGMSRNMEAPGNGFGRKGIILTGHDHEGCSVHHHLPESQDHASRA
ncbi:MAG: hypothetical protein Q9163_003535 [Psora crenata]